MASRYCEARIPENIDNLKFSYILEQILNGVIIYKIFRHIDMSAEEFKVYSVRPGTQEEYEKCTAQ